MSENNLTGDAKEAIDAYLSAKFSRWSKIIGYTSIGAIGAAIFGLYLTARTAAQAAVTADIQHDEDIYKKLNEALTLSYSDQMNQLAVARQKAATIEQAVDEINKMLEDPNALERIRGVLKAMNGDLKDVNAAEELGKLKVEVAANEKLLHMVGSDVYKLSWALSLSDNGGSDAYVHGLLKQLYQFKSKDGQSYWSKNEDTIEDRYRGQGFHTTPQIP